MSVVQKYVCEEKEEIVGETEIVVFVFQAWQCRALISIDLDQIVQSQWLQC